MTGQPHPPALAGDFLAGPVWHLDWFARGFFTDPAEWQLAVEEFAQARAAYYAAARRDLGISGEIQRGDVALWLDRLNNGQMPPTNATIEQERAPT